MAVAYWSEQMAQDTSNAYQKHQEKLRDEEFRKFIREVNAGRIQKPRFARVRAV